MEPAETRARLIESLAGELAERLGEGYLRVAIDGVDGSGKTTFAAEIVAALQRRSVRAVGISADDFLNERAVRYRQGRDSPRGFYEDSVDEQRLVADVLGPFAAEGRFSRRGFDLQTDTALAPTWKQVEPPAVLVVDGIFLHRPQLRPHWDLSVWLDVPFAVSVARMAARDGTNPDPEHPSVRRYVEGQRIYIAECDPATRADVVIDNADLQRPAVVRDGRTGG